MGVENVSLSENKDVANGNGNDRLSLTFNLSVGCPETLSGKVLFPNFTTS